MLTRGRTTWGALLAAVAGPVLLSSAQAQSERHHHHTFHHGGAAYGPLRGEGPWIMYHNYSGFWGPISTGSIGPGFLTSYGTMLPVPVFLSVPQGGLLPPANPPVFMPPAAPAQPGFGVLAPDNEPVRQAPRLWVSNAEARSRATHFVEIGDDHFRKQKFNDAYARYRDAAKEAPDLAEPYLHQAFALAAMGQYENAVKTLKRGLALKPDWPQAGFQLKSLYGPNKIAKIAHRESLAKAVTDHPQSADLMFLLAVVLYCDDVPQRSQAFFLRAKTLEPGDPAYLKGFLDVLARGPAVPPAPLAPREL